MPLIQHAHNDVEKEKRKRDAGLSSKKLTNDAKPELDLAARGAIPLVVQDRLDAIILQQLHMLHLH